MVYSTMKKDNLYNLTPDNLTAAMKIAGEHAYRARQISEWLYQKDVSDVGLMSNLPAALREKLLAGWSTDLPKAEEVKTGADGTEKWVLRLATNDRKTGKPHRIECVLMPSVDRYTLCVSSQVGCSLDCTFCATATMGFRRNLDPSEILGQVIHARKLLAEKRSRLSNIVFMGMGEPLLNFDNLCTALTNLTAKEAFGMSPTRITVSTSGVVTGLKELAERFQVGIAISLNAPTGALREEIMPKVACKYDLDSLLKAAKIVGQTRRKPVTFEYVLLAGVTDRTDQAKDLVKLLSGIRSKVNLIPFNPFQGSKFRRPEPQNVLKFQKVLWDASIPAYIRWSHGLDVSAACGQLAARG